MGLRRKAREAALQLLYQSEFETGEAEDGSRKFWSRRRAEKAVKDYADHLFRSVLNRREEIDGLLQSVSTHWRLDRMPVVDRNILRVAAAELLLKETDPAVIIDEAIEVARTFSSGESVAFVNGILDALGRKMGLVATGGRGKAHEPKKGQAPIRKRPGDGRRTKKN